MALERHVHAFRLNRERARVVVELTVDQEQRLLDLVRVVKRRHLRVHIRRFPEGARFVLKTKRRQRAVVGAAAGHAGRKDVRVREQVRRHERAVTVAADADARAIRNAFIHRKVHGRLRAGHKLLDVGVVGRLTRADDGHRRPVKHRVTLRQQEEVGRAAHRRETIRRSHDLTGRGGIVELLRIRPHKHREPLARLVAGWQVDGARQCDTVTALVGDEASLHVRQLWMGILERGDGRDGVRAQIANHVVRRNLGGLPRRDHASAGICHQQGHHRLVALFVTAPQPLRREGGHIHLVQERQVAFGRRAGTGQKNQVADLQDQVRCRTTHRGSGVAVAILLTTLPDLTWRRGPALVVHPASRHARRAVRLGHDDDALLGERHATKPPCGLHGCGRCSGKRRGEGHDLIAMRHLVANVALVERLDPDERRRFQRMPLRAPRTLMHTVDRYDITHRHIGDFADDPAGAIPDFDITRETGGGQQVRIRSFDARRDHVLAIGGDLQSLIDGRAAEGRGLA